MHNFSLELEAATRFSLILLAQDSDRIKRTLIGVFGKYSEVFAAMVKEAEFYQHGNIDGVALIIEER